MTSEAFTTTVTLSLALMPRSSTDSLVIEEVTIWPLPISTRTWEVVAPFFTSMTVPLIWLRALMRMMVLTKIAWRAASPAQLLTIDKNEKAEPPSQNFARAYDATIADLSVCLGRMKISFAASAATAWRPERPKPGGRQPAIAPMSSAVLALAALSAASGG